MARIYIDPGHGGSDPGTSWDGLREKDIVLTAGLACREALEAAGHEVRMSRTGDTDTTVSGIIGGNNGWADYHVSIHVNAGGGIGSEAWVHYDKAATVGDELAETILEGLAGLGFSIDRGIRTKRNNDGEDYYFNVRETDCPAVLVEIGFIDCDKDRALMDTAAKQKAIGQAIAGRVISFLGGAKPAPAPAPSRQLLDVDGIIGPATVTALQQWLGTSADGVISDQLSAMSTYWPALKAVEWGRGGGSPCVRALQRAIGAPVDGELGPETARCLQRFVGSPVDGYVGPNTARALQKFLNRKK